MKNDLGVVLAAGIGVKNSSFSMVDLSLEFLYFLIITIFLVMVTKVTGKQLDQHISALVDKIAPNGFKRFFKKRRKK